MSNQKSLDQFIAEGRSPINKSYDCYILAEGDSWFNLGFFPTPGKARNLLDPLHFKKDTRGVKDFLGAIENCYIELANYRSTVADGKNKDTVIITHCYDYIQPRNAPAKILKSFGPWVYTAMTEVYKIPEKFWLDIVNYMFEELQKMMVGLETKIDKFHVLKTLGTLTLAKPHTKGNSNDWKNEIHPKAGGYEKLAKTHIQPLIDQILT